jgi:hypothetical protein
MSTLPSLLSINLFIYYGSSQSTNQAEHLQLFGQLPAGLTKKILPLLWLLWQWLVLRERKGKKFFFLILA